MKVAELFKNATGSRAKEHKLTLDKEPAQRELLVSEGNYHMEQSNKRHH